MAKLVYVGGLVLQAHSPRELARWYTDKFGLSVGIEYEGGLYGGFRTGDGGFHFGIVPRTDESVQAGGISITFRVDDFDGYLAQLRANGLQPESEEHHDEGRFATFRDPEGYEVAIWGE